MLKGITYSNSIFNLRPSFIVDAWLFLCVIDFVVLYTIPYLRLKSRLSLRVSNIKIKISHVLQFLCPPSKS